MTGITDQAFKEAQAAELMYWDKHTRDKKQVRHELVEHAEVADPLRRLMGDRSFAKALEVGIGCFGLGFLAVHFEDHVASIDGLDPLPRLDLSLDDEKLQERVDGARSRVHYIQAQAEDIPANAGTYDLVSCINVVDQAQAPWQILKEIDRVLKPGCVLVFSVSTLSLAGEAMWRIRRAFRPNAWGYVAHPHTFQWGMAARLVSTVGGRVLWNDKPTWISRLMGHGRMSFWIVKKDARS